MNIDFVFKIAGIGIIVTVISQLLTRAGRDDIAMLATLSGLVVAWILDGLLSFSPQQRGQMYLFAALPPAVFCFMIAELYDQEPDKVAPIVMLGNLAALAFVPLGLWMGLP